MSNGAGWPRTSSTSFASDHSSVDETSVACEEIDDDDDVNVENESEKSKPDDEAVGKAERGVEENWLEKAPTGSDIERQSLRGAATVCDSSK